MNAGDVVEAIQKVTEVIVGIGTQLGAKAVQFEKDAEPLAAAIVHAIAGGMTEQDKRNIDAAVISFHNRIQAPLPDKTDDDV